MANFHPSIIIPAAGAGRRMKSYGAKSLIDIGNQQTVISRQIKILKQCYPHSDIVVVVGYESEKVAKVIPKGIRVVENENYDNNNVLRSIGLAMRVIDNDNLIVVYGDLVFNKYAVDWAFSHGSSVLVDSRNQINEEEVGLTVVDGRVRHFSYGLRKKWAQVIHLKGREFDLFRSISLNPNNKNLFGFEALNMILEQGGRVRAVEPDNMRIVEIDTTRDILSARGLVSSDRR